MINYTHPDVLHIERTGHLYNEQSGNERIGDCEQCGEGIYSEYCGDAYETDSGLMFCCTDCCYEYFGIRSMDR